MTERFFVQVEKEKLVCMLTTDQFVMKSIQSLIEYSGYAAREKAPENPFKLKTVVTDNKRKFLYRTTNQHTLGRF